MQSEIIHAESDKQVDGALIDVAWQRIRQHLEEEKQRIFQEIRYYPPPIPACDVQFNSLLAERVAIIQELGQVEGFLKQRLTSTDPNQLLDEFMRTSHFVNGELADTIRQLR